MTFQLDEAAVLLGAVGLPDTVGPLLAESELVATVPVVLAKLLAKRWGLRVLEPPLALPRYTVSLYWHERYHRDEGNRWLRALFGKP